MAPDLTQLVSNVDFASAAAAIISITFSIIYALVVLQSVFFIYRILDPNHLERQRLKTRNRELDYEEKRLSYEKSRRSRRRY